MNFMFRSQVAISCFRFHISDFGFFSSQVLSSGSRLQVVGVKCFITDFELGSGCQASDSKSLFQFLFSNIWNSGLDYRFLISYSRFQIFVIS